MKNVAKAVIGANYGDEGKGLMVDYFARKSGERGTVVRFNGGAQAGHTVVAPSGLRHVFHHFGSGTLAGWDTFLSRHFICNPFLFRDEREELTVQARVQVDPQCLVTVPSDMLINQCVEQMRRSAAHGSCGVGINETVERSREPEFRLTVEDLRDGDALVEKLDRIENDWVRVRMIELGVLGMNTHEEMAGKLFSGILRRAFLSAAEEFCRETKLASQPLAGPMIFEGAQGLLLDQGHKNFPHVTRSNTGLQNVAELADEWGTRVEAVYVTRSYLTRHGNGPFPEEKTGWSFADETNRPHTFQGTIRFGELNLADLEERIQEDVKRHGRNLVGCKLSVTHLDQWYFDGNPDYESRGPTAADVKETQCGTRSS